MRISANGITINVDVRGQADPALVFLHYWGGSSRTWDGVIRRLDGNHRTVAIDFRGWGDSDKPATGYRIEELANDVTAVLAELKLSRFILVGHSMGAKVAQSIAGSRPAGLVGLVLVATGSPHGVKVPEEQLKRMLHAYDSAGSAAFVRDNVLTKRPLDNDVRVQIVEDNLKAGEAAKVAWPSVAIAQDVAKETSSIAVPTLVIGGELDQVDTPAILETVISIIPNAQLEIVKGSGHLLPLEAPEEVSMLINSFRRDLRRTVDRDGSTERSVAHP
jgi:pimeloyl-ACP methyl ester carboxylesterase